LAAAFDGSQIRKNSSVRVTMVFSTRKEMFWVVPLLLH
jgi:hypothetical protein